MCKSYRNRRFFTHESSVKIQLNFSLFCQFYVFFIVRKTRGNNAFGGVFGEKIELIPKNCDYPPLLLKSDVIILEEVDVFLG